LAAFAAQPFDEQKPDRSEGKDYMRVHPIPVRARGADQQENNAKDCGGRKNQPAQVAREGPSLENGTQLGDKKNGADSAQTGVQ